jgi:16S rRNA U516 pseudouridylate synthase RsuA-like enzyme
MGGSRESGVGSREEQDFLPPSVEVLVNGEVETRRGRKLRKGDVVEVGDALLEVG